MASITCPSCQAVVSSSTKFCGNCGAAIPQQTAQKVPSFLPYCTKCFSSLQPGMKFCQECGAPAVSEEVEFQKLLSDAIDLKIQKGSVLDFEENIHSLDKRAKRWAFYEARDLDEPMWAKILYHNLLEAGYVLPGWLQENRLIKTDNPKLHEAYFKYRALFTLLYHARPTEKGYFEYNLNYTGKGDNEYILAPHMVKHLINMGWDLKEDEIIPMPNFPKDPTEIDRASLPPEKPIRIEVAGTIISFTTYKAVVVVYVDNALKGKEIEIRYIRDESCRFKAPVVERIVDGTAFYAAIFTDILMLI